MKSVKAILEAVRFPFSISQSILEFIVTLKIMYSYNQHVPNISSTYKTFYSDYRSVTVVGIALTDYSCMCRWQENEQEQEQLQCTDFIFTKVNMRLQSAVWARTANYGA
jgi:hypothetical protein